MSSSGLSKERLRRMHEAMEGHVARGAMPGLVTLISRRGEVHVDAVGMKAVAGSDPMRRDTLFRIASMTKPMTAAAAMILVEECTLRLDDPVDRLLPELADRRVLKRLDGALDDTVPARRPITLRDLLTLRMGLGHIMAPSSDYPIRKALNEQQLLLGPPHPQELPTPDEWIRRVAAVPLMHHPGEMWMYDLGLDVLGVLIARAAGRPLEAFMRERLFEPLGMKDTGFSVPAEAIDRLATSYAPNPKTGALDLYDVAKGGQWSRPPAFASGSGGLVSTADDCLAFAQMMLNKGRHGRERILSRPSIELMTTDHLTPEQKAGNRIFFGENCGWGFGMSVINRRGDLAESPGTFGWDGGLGTSFRSDPREELVGVLLTQSAFTSPSPPVVLLDFWTSVYQAIDD
ncbi:serine hydrolase domain-containing protein [Chondromyces apiculatus]|uniref:Beta-lactamase class C and other penicillin binding protein n=1 Tax=Chondromyces apiculatus DSM 436 TaxID=1192034 RepID=A0A017SVL4_9BACT|nr:serine hydrolase domain-containing protein [Chondromyces apiculatus]EYF00812.1 Beta-lactamase class C and other penicillin binding protein [Chondromyces apiculatus DSM 436]